MLGHALCPGEVVALRPVGIVGIAHRNAMSGVGGGPATRRREMDEVTGAATDKAFRGFVGHRLISHGRVPTGVLAAMARPSSALAWPPISSPGTS